MQNSICLLLILKTRLPAYKKAGRTVFYLAESKYPAIFVKKAIIGDGGNGQFCCLPWMNAEEVF